MRKALMTLLLVLPVIFLLTGQSVGKQPIKGPCVQFADDPSKGAIVVWWETGEESTGYVEYAGSKPRKVSDNKKAKRHEVTLTGLKPGEYNYKLGGDVSGAGTFEIPQPRKQAFRFAAFGDSRAYDASTLNLIKQMIADKPEFIIAQGDYIHKPGDPQFANWEQCFQSFKALFNHVPFMPAIGDHDDGDKGMEYKDNFVLPNNELWYSYDWGRCHFVSLWISWSQTFESDSEQLKWLKEDLQNAARKGYDFIFVYGHLPMNTVGNYGDEDSWRTYTRLLPVFKQYGVQVSFGAHDHNYQHWEFDGHTHILSGGLTSDRLYPIKYTEKADNEKTAGRLKQALSVPHYVLVEVDGKKAVFTAKGEDGKVLDQFEITALKR